MNVYIPRIFSFPVPKVRFYYNMASADKDWWKKAKSIYEFSAKDIDGNDVCLEKYKDHVVLILNVASK